MPVLRLLSHAKRPLKPSHVLGYVVKLHTSSISMELVQPTRLRELTQDPRTTQQALSPTDKEPRGARSEVGLPCGCWTCRMGGDQGRVRAQISTEEQNQKKSYHGAGCDYYSCVLTCGGSFHRQSPPARDPLRHQNHCLQNEPRKTGLESRLSILYILPPISQASGGWETSMLIGMILSALEFPS